MGGKSSAPPPPDYTGAAQAQAGASKEITNIQNYANRPTINTPFGTQSWGTQAVVDPATGQPVTQWTQNTTLAPGLQSALSSQIGVQNARSQLAGGFMGRVADEYSQPFDYENLPAMAQANLPGSLQTRTTDYAPGLQTGFNFGSPLPQMDAGFRDRVADQLMERMQPTHDRQMQGLQTQLTNQGFQVGSEAFNKALGDLQGAQSKERFNALDQSGAEAQRLFNMQMQTSQQGFNQNLGAAQFNNQALGQANALDLANMQAGNQALGQQYGLNQQFADSQNRLRQQAIAEQAQRRGMSLNEMNALLSGQQVSMPTMPSFNTAQRSETPQLVNAANMGYQANLAQSNAQNAGFDNLLNAGTQLGSAAFMFSDARLKTDIVKIGEHSPGISLYRYRWVGSTIESEGVLAQEVQKVRPDLVRKHASGFLQVNYGSL